MSATIYLIRHGETAWSRTGRHTGRADLPLTAAGEHEALSLRPWLSAIPFTTVFSSPATRARQTGAAAGLPSAVIDPDAAEWDYGEYEGRRTSEILAERPGWNLFIDGCPGGESPSDVSARCDRLVARWRQLDGAIAVLTHGHVGRALATRWIGSPVTSARGLQFDTAAVGILAWDPGRGADPVIRQWNLRPGAIRGL